MHRTEWNALRARMANNVLGGIQSCVVTRDELTALLDELDALRPLAVLGAKFLRAAASNDDADVADCKRYADTFGVSPVGAMLGAASGPYATPHIAATVARLTQGGTDAD